MSRPEPVLPRHDEDHGIQRTWRDVVKLAAGKVFILIGFISILAAFILVDQNFCEAPMMAELNTNTEKKMQAAHECENMQSIWFI